ncbi:Cystathionine gamma-synthase [Xylanimonas cellulosilytica DSM 15894]|uniref:Cystathionine gamma-synthase n=1 Tax=Xylanimonas cellulosilytica (strain DSM 15894 / JCM 12276 / CECT 5975 / KCTC 9989 / LMG 20990 / NBRC 107835 / XIL07) TaxID=446471 RepID=D1BX84_XYLCX|nr:cystathionine gamma-synthase [Xylanimonas cellulosilytica]ACZ31652.1 Cystathionine gamma-synthase [Xylanimonas cellulosilytica DSM 15894]
MTHDWNSAGFSTRAIHAGQDPDPTTGAVVPPVYLTSTFKQDGVGGLRGGYEYSRSANPTRTALETALAAAETPAGGPPAHGFAFASGLAAEDTVLRAVLRPGDHVILPDDAYGGSYRLIARVFGAWGVEHTAVDLTDPAAVAAAVRPGTTRVVWVETPTNPLLGISDIAALATVAHDADALLVVDNTFATPYLQTPLALGADVVVHSTTKYVAGHSDVVGGALVVADGVTIPGGRTAPDGARDVAAAVRFHQNASGAVADPFAAWLTLRGLKTLAVRMDRHQANALAVALFLEAHPRVTHVLYPGLASHPGHELAARQMRGFGGMVAFRTGSEATALDVVARTRVFTLAESLGGVESLIEHPGRMTHASVAGSSLEVPADLVRVSVGIEDADDLVTDLAHALEGTA